MLASETNTLAEASESLEAQIESLEELLVEYEDDTDEAQAVR